MLFNSIEFAKFFIIVYSLYLVLNHKWQNRMLLVASYVFYGWWDWRFLFLIFASTLIDYICGLAIFNAKNHSRKKLFLLISIFSNLLLLGFFKYYSFFVSSFQKFLLQIGISVHPYMLNIILPVGISFYTFQTMSYTIDIYRDKLKPANNFFDFALFVSFFTQLVAGPIEKAKDLLPQIISKRDITLDMFFEGCYLIFWGLFQKIFVADNLAPIVEKVFAVQAQYSGMEVLLGTYAFAFQIFCDFAGYSNIARGLGKCMGFDITINFNLPYFSANPKEFWQRWHISLSTWLKDYLYIPLGGNKKGEGATYRNLGITMILGGLWHGAAWTFVIWGIYHGLLLILHRVLMTFLRLPEVFRNVFIRKIWFVIKCVFFFHLVCFGWLIFRAHDITQVFNMLHGIIYNFKIPSVNDGLLLIQIISFTWLLIFVQVFQYLKKDLMCVYKSNIIIRSLFYAACMYVMIKNGVPNGKAFIYYIF